MDITILNAAYSEINNLLYKSYLPKIINTAIEIGVFKTLSRKGFSFRELSKELNTNKSITESLLEVLTAINFTKKQDGKYSLTSLSNDYLVNSSDVNQLGAIKEFSGSAGPFDNLTKALKGELTVFNQKMWSSKEAIMGMEQGAKAGSLQAIVAFAKEIDEFTSATKMCDFAGSSGYYSFALMKENSKLYSHVYDLPAVCKIANDLKKDEQNFDRISYHAFDVMAGDSFGNNYDLFFSSHFLYKFSTNNTLIDFLKRVNQSMMLGGLFISHHISGNVSGDSYLTLLIVELMTRAMGYPTHHLPEDTLKNALSKTGFGNFKIKQSNENIAFPGMLLSAIKTKEI